MICLLLISQLFDLFIEILGKGFGVFVQNFIKFFCG